MVKIYGDFDDMHLEVFKLHKNQVDGSKPIKLVNVSNLCYKLCLYKERNHFVFTKVYREASELFD